MLAFTMATPLPIIATYDFDVVALNGASHNPGDFINRPFIDEVWFPLSIRNRIRKSPECRVK